MSSDVYHKFKKDDIETFLDNDLYLPTRTIFMGSSGSYEGSENGVDYLLAERIIKSLHILDTQDEKARKGEKPITIFMNCIGGEVIHGMAIHDAIRNCSNHVTIKVFGHSMSMGAVILQSADHRMMSANSRIMIHIGSDGYSGHAKNSYKWNNESKKDGKWMEELFLSKIKGHKITLEKYLLLVDKPDEIPKGNAKNKMIEIDIEKLRTMLDFDTIIDAETALELNLIDEIIKGK